MGLVVVLKDAETVDPAERAEEAACSSEQTQPRIFAAIRKLAWVEGVDWLLGRWDWLCLCWLFVQIDRWLFDVVSWLPRLLEVFDRICQTRAV